ncbi:MAG: hypothetical protein LVQ97_00350 [Candidatus Micrarchaeales archaeon]|jgi:hypothetical protein|uniref:Uncharacterized protein n=1 Tax=Candidatus Micrarchaeum acidiphilum ARMAN-2 TaxID=425595 RepID=C7DHF6_MICA2|nr:MAG: hypothetical protein UNLARM2_0500 [Candidatus Micrarchaeum acidiphilum ARMAN-2]MCW6160626.1 hypothetical protein [Candidatus Micrarchaeales archaeon]
MKALYALLAAFVVLVVLAALLLAYKPQLQSQSAAAEVLPGKLPTMLCPALFYQISSNITGISGLYEYNVSGYKDFVLLPGSSGSINVSTRTGPPTSRSIIYPPNATVNNTATFYHTPISGSSKANVSNSHPGISVEISPVSDPMGPNKEYSYTARISASIAAQEGTYWLSIGPPMCLGNEMVLLTIGTKPFSNATAAPLYN